MSIKPSYIITDWWFQPLWKILVNWDDSSQYMGKWHMFQTTNQIMNSDWITLQITLQITWPFIVAEALWPQDCPPGRSAGAWWPEWRLGAQSRPEGFFGISPSGYDSHSHGESTINGSFFMGKSSINGSLSMANCYSKYSNQRVPPRFCGTFIGEFLTNERTKQVSYHLFPSYLQKYWLYDDVVNNDFCFSWIDIVWECHYPSTGRKRCRNYCSH